jgi:hypothetical protein
MKREFVIPIKTLAHSKEEAEAQVNLLLQMGAFLKDYNVQNLAGAFVGNLLYKGLGNLSEKYETKKAAPVKNKSVIDYKGLQDALRKRREKETQVCKDQPNSEL